MPSHVIADPLLIPDPRDEVVAAWTQLLQAQGQDTVDGWFALALQYQGEGQFLEAEIAWRQLVQHYPGDGGAWINLAFVLEQNGRPEEMMSCYQQALHDPTTKELAFGGIGSLLMGSEESEAIRLLQHVIDDPGADDSVRAAACCYLGLCWQKRRFSDASIVLEKAIALGLEEPLAGQIWKILAKSYALSGRGEQRDVNRVVGQWVQRLPGVVAAPFGPRKPGKTRIGLCSAFFGWGQAQDFFVAALVPTLNRCGVEACCYPLSGSGKRGWDIPATDVSDLSAKAAAERVRQDDLDCLITIDLLSIADHEFYQHRPARLMLSMSHAFSSCSLVDGLILDPWLVPPGSEGDFTEAILSLKSTVCFVSDQFVHARPCQEIVPPPCLRRGYITFGSHNRPNKIDADCVALWAKAMDETPNSRICLRSSDYDDAHMQRISALFAASGIERQRIDLYGPLPHEAFFQGYGDMDIALDPLRFSGGLSTVDALWYGVPVVTLPGNLIVNRMSASILAAIGCEQWIARDLEDWLAIVTRLAACPQALSAWRTWLRPALAASPVLDPERMAEDLLAALRASHDL